MYVPILKSADDFSGAWDPSTATLDWCEANYVWSFYIAEWWNTVSNLVMILLGLHGAARVYLSGGEHRFIFSFLTLFVVGSGSWLFHMTLSYPMQLVDELSMLFCVSTLIYCALEINSKESRANYPLAFGLLLATTLLSATYMAINHPVFHQVMYSLNVAVLVFKIAHVLRAHRRYWKPFGVGVAMYVVAISVWKMDVHYCRTLRDLRSGPMRATSVLLELHAWWHVLAGLSTYLIIVTLAAVRSDVTNSGMDVYYVAGVFPLLVARKTHGANGGRKKSEDLLKSPGLRNRITASGMRLRSR